MRWGKKGSKFKDTDMPETSENQCIKYLHCNFYGFQVIDSIHRTKHCCPLGWNTWLKVIKLFSCLTQLNLKFILLINVKMPTIVGILTFMSMINATFESFKARNIFVFRYFSFCQQVKLRTRLSWAWKKFYNLGAKKLGPLALILLKMF